MNFSRRSLLKFGGILALTAVPASACSAGSGDLTSIASLRSRSSDVDTVVFSPRGDLLAATGFLGVDLWSVDNWNSSRALAGPRSDVSSIAFSPDGSRIIAAADAIYVWNATTAALVGRLGEAQTGSGQSIRQSYRYQCVEFLTDGDTIAAGLSTGDIELWSLSRGTLLRKMVGHSGGGVSLAVNPDGKTLCSGGGGYDQTIREWDISSGQCLRVTQQPATVLSLAYNQGGSLLAATGNAVSIFSTISFDSLKVIEDQAEVRCVAFAPDSNFVAFGDQNGFVNFADALSGKLLLQAQLGFDGTTAVAVSPDGKMIACGGGSAELGVWQFPSFSST